VTARSSQTKSLCEIARGTTNFLCCGGGDLASLTTYRVEQWRRPRQLVAMVPHGGTGGKSSSPNPSSGPPMTPSYSYGGSSGVRRALGGHLTPPSQTGSRTPSPRYVSGWKRSNENSMTPPRGAESDAYRHVGGGLSYPGWLFGSSGTGLADPFPSMWLSALFLHVHPKKQVIVLAPSFPDDMMDLAEAHFLFPQSAPSPRPLLPSCNHIANVNSFRRRRLLLHTCA